MHGPPIRERSPLSIALETATGWAAGARALVCVVREMQAATQTGALRATSATREVGCTTFLHAETHTATTAPDDLRRAPKLTMQGIASLETASVTKMR